jgi:hypothetical protein
VPAAFHGGGRFYNFLKECFMKRMVFCIIPLIIIFMECASNGTAAAGTNSSSHGMDLDAAIRDAAAQMGENLPGGTKVALVSVASSSTQFSEYVISRLEAALVSGKKLVVVDRANLDKVREEQGFQLSGEVDDDSAKSIGKLLGAGAIVTGAFADLGDVYSLTLKAINIETATVAVSYPADIAKSTRIETLLASGGGAGGAQTAQRGNTSGNTTAQAAPPVPTYKIGDTGPAGGLIFYDKGNNTGGWRYLEAAPVDIDRKLYATEEGIGIEGQRAVGTGKANTQAIMVQANNRGGGFGWAAQACDALEVNGFDDWFLPSRDELHYMYGNLHMRNLGGFSLDWYWSSTYSRFNAQENWMDVNKHYWWGENFSDGTQAAQCGNKDAASWTNSQQRFRVRAIRQF